MNSLRTLFILVVAAALAQPYSARSQSPNQSPTLSSAKKCLPVAPGPHERYRLTPNKELPPGISFATDWARIKTGGWFGQQSMDGCRLESDGVLTWHGKASARVEVQPKDDPLNLKSNSERAEMLIMQDAKGNAIKENSGGGTQYYATSYYFPVTWQGQQLPWSAFAPTDCSVGDQNQCNSWSAIWQFYGWGALGAVQTSVGGPQEYLFNNTEFTDGGRLQLGKWTDFVFMVDWNTGAFTVWRRDEGQINFKRVLNGKTPVTREVYIKQGLYRGGNVNGRTDVLWIGPTARGTSFSAVERQAFDTDTGPSADVK
jgi:hypothetical protein